MKNISINITNKNLINLKKIEYINDNSYIPKQSQEKKRLLHFALMKFIKTQYNKRPEILINHSKKKEIFEKYNNLNLLPYLNEKINRKHNGKNMYFSAYPKFTGFPDNKHYYSKTNNINEYISKRNTLHAQQKSNKEKEIKEKRRAKNKNIIKSSFIGDTSNYRNFLENSSDNKQILTNKTLLNKEIMKNKNNMEYLKRNSNFQIYNFNLPSFKRKNSSNSHNNDYLNEDDINNEKTNFDTPQRDSSLNYKNKMNSFISEINNKKLMNYINDISNNTEIHHQDIIFGKTYKKFEQIFKDKNKNNLHKNLTYGEEKNDSKLINKTPEKKDSNGNNRNKLETYENKSEEKIRLSNYIKLYPEIKNISATEIKRKTENQTKNINIKKYKFNLKQMKNDYEIFHYDKYDKYEVKTSKEGSKNSFCQKKKPLLNIRKMEIIDKFCVNTKFGEFTNKDKITHNYPISFNRVINTRKNNNNDIIDLI